MAVKVLITRRFKQGKGMELLGRLNKLRGQAMNQPGYITGETIVGLDDPQKLLVIGTWQSGEHWKKWKEDPSRVSQETNLEDLLAEPTRYEVFSFGTFPPRD
ncbi:MAG: antibiotic biosynthesis monooxygenase [Thermodesulfobacteriota bacterium]